MKHLGKTSIVVALVMVLTIALAPVCLAVDAPCSGGCPHDAPAVQQEVAATKPMVLAPAVDPGPAAWMRLTAENRTGLDVVPVEVTRRDPLGTRLLI